VIRNILLDLDDTLLDFRTAEKQALSKTLRRFGIEPTEERLARYSEINAQHWKMLERGEVTRSELRVRRYRVFLEELGVSSCEPAEVARQYEAQLRQEYAVLPGAMELLEALRPYYRLYAVTNGSTENQKGRLKGSGVGAYFDEVFISQEVGHDKPSKEYFDHCFAHIPDFRKEETVIVGDSLSSDITGGSNAGIATIWFAPNGQESDLPDVIIRSLEELPELLKNWT